MNCTRVLCALCNLIGGTLSQTLHKFLIAVIPDLSSAVLCNRGKGLAHQTRLCKDEGIPEPGFMVFAVVCVFIDIAVFQILLCFSLCVAHELYTYVFCNLIGGARKSDPAQIPHSSYPSPFPSAELHNRGKGQLSISLANSPRLTLFCYLNGVTCMLWPRTLTPLP